MAYLPHIDGLRAIAIAMVVLYHAWPKLLPGGFIGVDVFFVISGFLITRIIAAEMACGEFSYVRFLARRVRRLAPAAVLMLGVVLAIGAIIFRPDALKSLGHAVALASVLLANVHFYRTGGYFSAPPEEKPILHMWSLAVEDQFYLTWPLLLLFLLVVLKRRGTIAVVLTLASASLVHAQMKLSADADFAFYILSARAWELLVGCLLALLTPLIDLKGKAASIAAWAGFLMIVASALLLNQSVPFPGIAALPAALGTAAVIAAGLQSSNAMTRLLEKPPVVFIGLISYSLYLWHWPILSLSQYVLSRGLTAGEAAAAVGLSLVVAIASWRYVEQPFRKQVDHSQRGNWRTIAIGSAAIASVLAVGALFKIFDGLPERFDGPVRQIYADMSHGNPLRPACDGTDRIFGTDETCAFGRKPKPGESYEVAVFGDSNADHFVPAIAAWVGAKNLLGRQVTKSACALLFNVQRPGLWSAEVRHCDDYRRAAIRFIEQNPKLRLAILGGDWRDYINVLDNPDLKLSQLTSVTWSGEQVQNAKGFEIALGRTVDFLLARGINVHILGQIPIFENLPTTCIAKSVAAGHDTHACGVPRQVYNSRQGPIDEALRRIAASRPGVSLSFPSQYICDDAICSPYHDGTYMYRNHDHLSLAGSLKLRDTLNFPRD